LQERPPCTDLFGVKGRQWLAGLELPLEERESVDAGIRQVEFLDVEIAAVERLIARQALSWPEIRRLMTVPGVNLICAATFIAAVGTTERFLTSRKLVAYLGLDPKVRQSGEGPARSGRISKRGSASARWGLVEAAWSVVLQPGPLHAFYERTRDRRGHGKAIVATARKLAVLFWNMLRRGEDYAHQQPSLTKKKLRRLEITAGAAKHAKSAAGVWSTNDVMRDAERQLALQAEASYRRMVSDQKPGGPGRKVGASVTLERASVESLERGQAARQTQSSRRLRFATSVTRARRKTYSYLSRPATTGSGQACPISGIRPSNRRQIRQQHHKRPWSHPR
jgi:hypothetical protein